MNRRVARLAFFGPTATTGFYLIVIAVLTVAHPSYCQVTKQVQNSTIGTEESLEPIQVHGQSQGQLAADIANATTGIERLPSPPHKPKDATPKKLDHHHEDDKSRKLNMIFYYVLTGFAILLLATAMVCFIGCFCFPSGFWIKKSRLHLAGRVYEKPDPIANPAVFMVELPVEQESGRGRGHTYIKIVSASSSNNSVLQQAPKIELESKIAKQDSNGSELKQLPHNPFFTGD